MRSPVTLSLSHTPTPRLEIIKLSQTVGVIRGYLVYKLGIIKEDMLPNRAADIFIWPKYDSTQIPCRDLHRHVEQGVGVVDELRCWG